MKLKTLLGGVAGAALLAAALVAATPNGIITGPVVPLVSSIGTSDVFQDIVNGVPQAPNYYATAGQITGVPGYTNAGAFSTTSYSFTFTNSVSNLFGQPSGTAASVTLTTSPNPGDGQRECFLSTQTTTAISWLANSTVNTQSISGAPTAGVANTTYCMTYVAAASTWYRSP